MSTPPQAPPGQLHAYEPDEAFYDEALEPGGEPRAHYAELFGALDLPTLERARAGIEERLAEAGVAFGEGEEGTGAVPFVVDPFPRILLAHEWERIERGVAQRARALNAFSADVYGHRRIFADGLVPERVLDSADHLDPAMRWVDPPHHIFTHVAGLDIVRGPDGAFMCLEDNLRTPSGARYAAAARDALAEHLPIPPPAPSAMDDALEALARTIRDCAPDGGGDPSAILLSDGPRNSAWFEHRDLAARLGIPLVLPGELEVRGMRLYARIGGGLRPVDVIYRRTNEDRLALPDHTPTALGELLIGPVLAGRLAVCNAFGNGIADDKLAHVYADSMIRYYLGEEPVLASVPGYDLADPAHRAEALERFDELVVKPRCGHGGVGVVVCPHADEITRRELRVEIERHPERYVAQLTVALSTHPTLTRDGLEPRHLDLRPFAISGPSGVTVARGGLSRFAGQRGSLIVNSSQGGGAKDTWVTG